MDEPTTLTREEFIELYRKMLLIRRFDERAYDLYTRGLLPGTVHASIGQEAVAVGTCANLRDDDLVFSNHRGHGHCIAKDLPLGEMMAEMLGKKTGLCKGKGGPMHLCDVKRGLLGCNGIVGANMPMAVGAGWSIKMRGTDQICVCFFGDGATNEGAFHESLNLAAVWKVPVLFVCENNFYAVSTHISTSTAIEHIANRASAYSMPGILADGMDVEAVYKVAKEAIEDMRMGSGPVLIEYETYRFGGHSRGDPAYGLYRTKEEVERWQQRDPLRVFKEKGMITEREAEAIDQEVRALVDNAVKFALESPFPDPEEALEDVYPAAS